MLKRNPADVQQVAIVDPPRAGLHNKAIIALRFFYSISIQNHPSVIVLGSNLSWTKRHYTTKKARQMYRMAAKNLLLSGHLKFSVSSTSVATPRPQCRISTTWVSYLPTSIKEIRSFRNGWFRSTCFPLLPTLSSSSTSKGSPLWSSRLSSLSNTSND